MSATVFTPLTISILGCGWLGMPLLQSLIDAGHRVRGSSRKPEVLSKIKAVGGQAFAIDLPQTLPPKFMDACDVLIITLPPRGRAFGEATTENYLKCFAPLANWLNTSDAPSVIFTSSTSVYGNAEGLLTESTLPRPATHSAHAVLAAEEWLATTGCPVTVLRLAGLVAADRHPGRFYGGKDRPIPDAGAPVNLVHRNDVIAAIHLCLDTNSGSTTYNVCAAAHPSKGAFYTDAANAIGLTVAGALPGGEGGKLIDSTALRNRGWQPTWDDLETSLIVS
ncbi:NAD-dependent epimerase/dehydratase family protein [Neolewinella persica]|uniref:NAD-dependent epimerase/dehydratase family protein n=1 Tax=Neolewinella persica TaxID=70998 RepID=UPI00036B37FE|nr:NAD-dependent epimerase/dehydratase family protein [Neolewinella persica]